MARRIFTDEDKARAYVVLTANQDNIKRTARDTGIAESTLRDWKREWADGGPPDMGLVAEAADDFMHDAERVRHKALAQLEKKLPDATPSALVATVGMLTDKIAMARGLATTRNETVHALPPAEEIAKTLGAAFEAALQAAKGRDLEIIDAEVVELPRARTAEQA